MCAKSNKKAINASCELSSKMALIEIFIACINDIEDDITEWHDFETE